MNKQIEIEKLGKVMCSEFRTSHCGNDCDCANEEIAKRLYEHGYRKASEIFAEIEKALSSMKYNANTTRKTVKVEELKEQVDWVLHEVVPNRIAELKKKYESEEAE